MPQFGGFVGAAYANESLAIDAQECLNLMPQADASGAGRSKAALVGTPGLQLHCTLPKSPVRGVFGGDGVYYAVAGNSLYQVFSDGTFTDRSAMSGATTLANDGLPVTMAPNGNQLLIVSGGNVYCDSGFGPRIQYFSTILGDMTIGPGANQITPSLTAPPFDSTDIGNTITITSASGAGWTPGTYTIIGIATSPPGVANMSAVVGTIGSTQGAGFETLIGGGPISARCCCFLNGYYLIAGSAVTSSQSLGPKQINISHPYDGTLWEILDNAVKAMYPDNIQFLLSDHSEVWVFGDNVTSEIWRDTGGAGNGGSFPFETDESAVIHQACIARFTPCSIANLVIWLGANTHGGPAAWMARGYSPQQISTHALEEEWAKYSRVDDAVAYVYTDRGHQCWVISFPSGNTTWVYDLATGLWHRRGWWNGSGWDRERVAFHAWEFGKHLGGDWQSGKIYWMNMTFYTDDGTPKYFRRAAPYLTDEWQRIPHNKLRLDMEYNAALTLTLAWSDDQGKTWTADRAIDGVNIDHGDPTKTIGVEWRRLATPRLRIYRVTGSGNARRSIVQAFINPPD